jgi:Uma2 family endonuclease
MATATQVQHTPEEWLENNAETQAQHTPEELLEITDRPMPELIDGQIVERPLMGWKSDAVAANVLFAVYGFVKSHQLGVVSGSQGSYQIFPDDPRKVRIPDVSFTRRERFAGGKFEEGHRKVAPDLVVEGLSPNDLAMDLFAKIRDFLDAGVPLIWVLNPGTRDVFVYRSDGTGAILRHTDELDGGGVLPGFRCPVADLFTI